MTSRQCWTFWKSGRPGRRDEKQTESRPTQAESTCSSSSSSSKWVGSPAQEQDKMMRARRTRFRGTQHKPALARATNQLNNRDVRMPHQFPSPSPSFFFCASFLLHLPLHTRSAVCSRWASPSRRFLDLLLPSRPMLLALPRYPWAVPSAGRSIFACDSRCWEALACLAAHRPLQMHAVGSRSREREHQCMRTDRAALGLGLVELKLLQASASKTESWAWK